MVYDSYDLGLEFPRIRDCVPDVTFVDLTMFSTFNGRWNKFCGIRSTETNDVHIKIGWIMFEGSFQ